MKKEVKKEVLYLVVPCYNEEEIIEDTVTRLLNKINELIQIDKIDKSSKIVLVDDGSKDKTWEIIKNLCKSNSFIRALKFSNNCGHQNAVLAGLDFSVDKCDYTISIDADLQQDIEAIDKFIDKYKQGNEIVYGIRNSRNTDSVFKKLTSQFFYKLMIKFGCKIIVNHADYRLVSNRVLRELKNYKEQGIFLRGLFPTMGFKNDIVYFDVFDRTAGKSKYTLKKMMNLATDGITSFSTFPLELIMITGIILFVISLFMMLSFVLFANSFVIYFGAMLFSTSIVVVCLGIIGEYIGKMHFELKGRPRYIIEELIDEKIK